MTTPDYLIVGAGSSGAALAGRLVEAGGDVALLEAGPDGGAAGEMGGRLGVGTGPVKFDGYAATPGE